MKRVASVGERGMVSDLFVYILLCWLVEEMDLCGVGFEEWEGED